VFWRFCGGEVWQSKESLEEVRTTDQDIFQRTGKYYFFTKNNKKSKFRKSSNDDLIDSTYL